MYMFRMHSIGSVRPRLFNPPLRPQQMQQLRQLQPEEQEKQQLQQLQPEEELKEKEEVIIEKEEEEEKQQLQPEEELKEKEEEGMPQPRCVEPETTVSAPRPKNKKKPKRK